MGNTTTNIIMILGFVTIVFAGYYLYTQQSTTELDLATDEQAIEEMLRNTQIFIGYGQTLDRINLELGILEDERFRSLQSHSSPVKKQPVGRTNPFFDTTMGNL